MPSPKKNVSVIPPTVAAHIVEDATQERRIYAEDSRIAARKAAMLQSRQIDMCTVVDTHDDLVREAFHLDKFVTLLSYDPETAKLDNSEVFLEYKAPHDLFTKATAASPSGRDARQTRRTTSELRQSVAATLDSTRPLGESKRSPVSVIKRGMGKPVIQSKDISPAVSPLSAKGKGKAVDLRSSSNMVNEVTSPPSRHSSSPTPLPTHTPSKRNHHPRRLKVHWTQQSQNVSEPIPAPPTIASRRTTRMEVPLQPPSDTRERIRRSTRHLKRESASTKDTSLEPANLSTSTTKPTVKRVKLFQRPRPAVYTHPSQIPGRSLHQGFISKFLDSFTSLEDGVDVTREELEGLSYMEARTRARIRELRGQGRLLLDIPVLPNGSIGIPSSSTPDGKDRQKVKRGDVYDHIVSTAARRGLIVAAEHGFKKATAKKVAKMVMAWHGNRETADEKQRKAEAVRLKALAKLTIKEVEKQWKKAVMAVRDHNRALLQAEEARIGRKHLDAILDQSGAILEAQHTELSRTRSRSSSAMDWTSDEGESGSNEDDEGSEEGWDGESSHTGGDDAADASWLLGAGTPHSAGSIGLSSDLEDASTVPETDEIPSHDTRSRQLSELSSFYPDDPVGSLPNGEVLDSTESVTSLEVSPRDHSATDDNHSRLTNDDPVDDYKDATHDFPLRHDRDNSISPPSQPPISPGISLQSPSQQSTCAIESSVTQTDQNCTTKSDGDERNSNNDLKDDDETMDISSSTGVVYRQDVESLMITEEPSELPSIAEPVKMANENSETQVLSDGSAAAEVDHQNDNTEHQPINSISIMNHVDDSTSANISSIQDMNGVDKPVADMNDNDPAKASPKGVDVQDIAEDPDVDEPEVPPYLVDFAAAPVEWDPTSKVNAPFLLRGNLRPYQQSGLEWLASLHTNSLNGILADEMGLGKTIQTIALLAHLACDRGVWGPHLIIVPTSVLLNWEMEFKKFLPGFKILPYHGSTKRRKELRVGWNNRHTFNVCVTSYTLASRDAHIFKRKSWYYMVLDEAHMIKNFKSQRWNILLMFRSFRRLLLTGTPLQNNLTELWALLQFLMSGTNFANVKEFGDWFSNPLEKAIEQGTVLNEETQERVRKLHTVLRPYLLRRLKIDVEKELPSKYEHLVMCRLSKRQRLLYDEFMSRAQTKDALASGIYHKIANILMQLRKVCNHPDLFEVRPVVTSFAMPQSAIMDFRIKELLVRRNLIRFQEDAVNLDFLGLTFVQHQGKSMMQARSTRTLDASSYLGFITELPGEPPPYDTWTIEGFKLHMKYQRQLASLRQWTQIAYINRLRCAASPVYGSETISAIRGLYSPLVPLSEMNFQHPDHLNLPRILPTLIKSHKQREEGMAALIDRFAFVTPPAVARDMVAVTLSGVEDCIRDAHDITPEFDAILHRTSIKLQIAFPDASLIQYDCGKLQELASLLRLRKAGGHRVLIFTQMTKVLDILEIFLNFHGYRYLRLDGATKIEDRQYITERFNNDDRVFAFIASSRSGGVGINLTGADTVIFYDSDFNPQMDRQCEDRAHRIGQIRDVHIYRFISEHTVEESMLRKANQKRSLDNIVIQQGEFDWRSLLIDDEAFGKALGDVEDKEDAYAARVAAREEAVREVEDHADFGGDGDDIATAEGPTDLSLMAPDEEGEPEEEGTIADYMLAFVKRDWEFFSAWR